MSRTEITARLASSDLGPGPRGMLESVLDAMPAPAVVDSSIPCEVFLTQLSVEGFRGVGPKVTLPLNPGPGLTVISGRNGSGKSSLAESIELLLTGDNARWADRNSDMRKGWKNLHHPGSTRIEVELSAKGASMMALSRTWTGEELAEGVSMVKRPGKDAAPLTSLGWSQSLVTYRPFLSYGELGGIVEDGPSKLYDAIANILGLEEFTAIKDGLAAKKSALKAQTKTSRDAWTAIASALQSLDDPRAQAVVALTAKKKWTPEEVESLVAESNIDNSSLSGWCRSILAIPALPSDRIGEAVDALRTATQAVADLHGSSAATALNTASILEQAIALHRSSHGTDCPVCGTVGVLTNDWLAKAEADASRLQIEAATARSASQRLDAAERALRQALPSPAAALASTPAAIDGATRAEIDGLRQAWAAAGSAFQSDEISALTDRAPALVAELSVELQRVQATVARVLAEADSDWSPLARRIRAWCDAARTLGDVDALTKDATSAEKWLDAVIDEFREQRLAPIRKSVESVWNDLRCDSNISLSNFELGGKGAKRRVNLELSVDNTPAPSLGVLSQGEMHALALSLFLPRAGLDESPFRFVVIDDPVQAMDPSKVDGLARQLARVAQTRQVIVLTHDDRLPEAVRRLGIEARVLEVVRGKKSGVQVVSRIDPTDRCLKAANDLLKDRALPPDIAVQVVAAQCRQAVEAESNDLIKTRMIRQGLRMDAIDETLEKAKTLSDLLSLLVLNDANRATEARMLINSEMRGAEELINLLQKQTHGDTKQEKRQDPKSSAPAIDPKDLLTSTRSLIRTLRAMEAT